MLRPRKKLSTVRAEVRSGADPSMTSRPRGALPLATGVAMVGVLLGGLPADEPADATAAPFGPLPIRSIDPLSLLFYQATAERADTLAAGRWEFSTFAHYASLSSGDIGDAYLVAWDEELLRWEIRARWGVTDRVELSVVLPFHYGSSGFLDSFIDDFHRFTGLGDRDIPDNEFLDVVAFGDTAIVKRAEGSFRVADLPIAAKLALWKDGTDPLGLALRAGVELPTGSASGSFGSGTVDGGFGAVAQKSLGDFTLYLAADASLQGSPDRFRELGVRVEPIVATSSAGAEWRALEWLAVSFQLDYAMPLIPGGDVPQLRRHRLLGTLGLQVAIGDRVRCTFGISEDFFITASTPDVTFTFGLGIRL